MQSIESLTLLPPFLPFSSLSFPSFSSFSPNSCHYPLQYSCLENLMDGGALWAAVHGIAKSRLQLSYLPFTFYFHALEKEMATHSSVLAWRIPGTGEPGGFLSIRPHRVGHDWSGLAAAAAAAGTFESQKLYQYLSLKKNTKLRWLFDNLLIKSSQESHSFIIQSPTFHTFY